MQNQKSPPKADSPSAKKIKDQRYFLLLASCFLLLAFISGCEKIPFFKKEKPKVKVPKVTGTVVAKVNDMVITLEELEEEIQSFNLLVPAERPEDKIDTRDEKINHLRGVLIRNYLLYQEGMSRGLDKKEEVQKALERMKRNLVVMELVQAETEKIEVSSSEIETYYNRFKEELREPEERRIREIIVPTEREATDVVIKFYQGEDFASLAKQYSKAPSAKDGGDIGFLKRGTKFSQYDTVAFAETLEPGRISTIFKGPDGYYILKLEEKKGGKLKSLSEMWDEIKMGLTFLKQQQKIEELISNLQSRAKITIEEGKIK